MKGPRRLTDDLKWALAVLAGCVIGFVLFGADDPAVLLGSLVGVAFVVVARILLRRRRGAPSA